jgi:hypothetical protein
LPTPTGPIRRSCCFFWRKWRDVQALYPAPATTCPPGTRLEVRGDGALVKLYKKGELVKVHPRQTGGGRATDSDDYPKAVARRLGDCLGQPRGGTASLLPSDDIFC